MFDNVDKKIQAWRQDEAIDDWQTIVDLSLKRLVEALRIGKYTAQQALHAYVWKALIVTNELNCCVEFVDEADTWARSLDESYTTESERKQMPLFGVPYSLKENYYLKGHRSTCGLAHKLKQPPVEYDSSIVQYLRALGAYPFVRTNIPQTLLSYVCTNPVYGTTENPLCIGRTPGGSSGGEAALMRAGGAIFGFGGDLAGSLRIPASFCGLPVIKPTYARLPIAGSVSGMPGVRSAMHGHGYFARDVESLDFLYGLTLTSAFFEMHPSAAPLPWRSDQQMHHRLRIGLATSDGWFEPMPCMRRGVDEAARFLEASGHELVPFEIVRPADAFKMFIKVLMPDNGEYLLGLFNAEPKVDKLLSSQYYTLRVPVSVRRLATPLIRWKWPRVAAISDTVVHSLSDMRIIHHQIDVYREEFYHHWLANSLDALLLPSFPFPAVEHHYPAQLFCAGFTTALFNLLDMPAGTVPITNVTASDVDELKHYELTDVFARLAVDSQKGSEKLPVCVQVVTKPYMEELCLSILRQLEKHFKSA